MSVRGERGTTLTELLFGLLILGVFASGLERFYVDTLKRTTQLAVSSEAEDATRITVEILERDLRDAGFSPDGWLDTGVWLAAPDAVGIERDLNGDHDTEDANEQVSYLFDAAHHRLMRRMGGAPPQPMLDHLSEDGFRLTYRDTDGNILAGEEELPGTERQRIRRIDIVLSLEIPIHGAAAPEPVRVHRTATVALRNGNRKADR